MTSADNHFVLARCAVDIRATIALLKARTFKSLAELRDLSEPLNSRRLNDIATAFDESTTRLLDAAVNEPTQLVRELVTHE